MSRVAIITPVYNAALYVEETIRSVLAQTYQDWQLILVDDGSTDDSLEICRRFQSDPRITVVSQSNRGVAAARNHGIEIAESPDYFTFLDSDDLLSKRFLEVAADYMDEHPEIDLFRSRFDRIRDHGEKWNSILEWRLWSHQRLTWDLFSDDVARLFLLMGTFPPVGLLFRSTAVTRRHWFQESLFGTEDSELLTYLALQNSGMHFSRFKGGCYRIRKSSISTDTLRRAENYDRWLDYSFSSIEPQKYGSDFKKLSSVIKKLQLSNGLDKENCVKMEVDIFHHIQDIDMENIDNASMHVLFSSLVNANLSNTIGILSQLKAPGSVISAYLIKRTYASGNTRSFLPGIIQLLVKQPINFISACLGLAGLRSWVAD